jgi:hypothetical protein
MSNDDPRFPPRGQMFSGDEPRTRPVEQSLSVSMLSEIHQRLSAVEQAQRDLHDKVDAAVQSGALEPGLQEHVAHVLRKHFYHDKPEAEAPAAPTPKFDPYTGERLSIN